MIVSYLVKFLATAPFPDQEFLYVKGKNMKFLPELSGYWYYLISFYSKDKFVKKCLLLQSKGSNCLLHCLVGKHSLFQKGKSPLINSYPFWHLYLKRKEYRTNMIHCWFLLWYKYLNKRQIWEILYLLYCS